MEFRAPSPCSNLPCWPVITDARCSRSMQRQSWRKRTAACPNCMWHCDGWWAVLDGSLGSRTSCQKSHGSQQVRLPHRWDFPKWKFYNPGLGITTKMFGQLQSKPWNPDLKKTKQNKTGVVSWSLKSKLWADRDRQGLGAYWPGSLAYLASSRLLRETRVCGLVVFWHLHIHMHPNSPVLHCWYSLCYYFVFFWRRSKINLQDLQGTCTKKAAWGSWHWTEARALGSQGLTCNLWIKNLNALSSGRWMDMISDTPAWFLALSETSEVLCIETPQMWKLWFFPCCVLERSHVDGTGALSTTDVSYSSFLKATTSWKLVISVGLTSPWVKNGFKWHCSWQNFWSLFIQSGL